MSKSKKVASLFLVAALAIGASAGCTTHDVHDENCPDEDQDGICDDIEEDDGDGYSTKKKKSYSSSKSGLSSGSKAGIGSSGSGSGG
ncbi:MAG TPA: hypothetical protein DDY49_03335 [Paenibacillaceae bacterium]|nr:hypothetical protein [Paenibacillaceae bacterium]